jgi:uncharacterized protein YndB with AHSA1/START domain
MSDAIDKHGHTILFERTLEATAEAVFDAWTQPEEIAQWWDPTGEPLVSCTIDLKPKGTFRFVMHGHAPPFEGTYLVVDRPRRLEFEAMGAKGTVTLHPHGKNTRMNVSIRCASAEHFETFLKLGVQAGTSVTLNNLVAHMSRAAHAQDAVR